MKLSRKSKGTRFAAALLATAGLMLAAPPASNAEEIRVNYFGPLNCGGYNSWISVSANGYVRANYYNPSNYAAAYANGFTVLWGPSSYGSAWLSVVDGSINSFNRGCDY
ncbi:hypothetical protein [Arthrobacter sp. FW306-2-2C-D06B]|uniref:hypothetical protein n=1 Tax=Arthrobacter sp. FW306-2-2C-D06B TaxID=2879618 RepID=UPI001F2BF95F|nr:hypothetical protein [Arthrobacter sp. FW306-2-2C-D06B]UKA58901.1 hypothetical protein LFT47_00660 [Arthrobacter sp. FW306-2-2C-D06B]